MSLALYRKYRPGSFAEVKGQEHVTGPLRQALTNGRIHHAYLFSGPRGCGKTSSARILARSLNCAEGPTPDPCGVCDSCIALAPNGPGSLDVIEIDAASHNGVDDARDLRDKAFYAPVSARFKVYIIDEAHMVTSQAFNALLKLVEEPPEFVKFVFATTEPEKVLSTIRSRTHHYPFRLMPRRDLTALLQDVLAAEGVTVEEQVLPLVVRAATGSARDALSILDQVIASAGPEGVTRQGAAGLLGVTPDVLLDEVLDAFSVRDAAAVFAILDQVMEGGDDPRRFAGDVLEHLRDLVILDAVPDAGEKGVLDCPPEKLDRMGRQVSAFGTAGLSRAADLFSVGLTEMRGTTAPRLLLELVCARVLLPAASGESSALLSRLERVERRLDIAAGDTSEAVRPVAGPAGRPVPPRSAAAQTDSPGRRGSPPQDDSEAGGGSAVGEPTAPASPPVTDPPRSSSDARPQAWPAAATPGAPRPPASGAPPSPGGSGAAVEGMEPGGQADNGIETGAGEPGAAPAPDAAGALDAAGVRRAWDSVLDLVKERKRVTHARLLDTQVAALQGRRLSLAFTTPTLARQFQAGANMDYLREALQSVLGVDLDVVCVSGSEAVPPTESGSRPGPASRPRTGRPAAGAADRSVDAGGVTQDRAVATGGDASGGTGSGGTGSGRTASRGAASAGAGSDGARSDRAATGPRPRSSVGRLPGGEVVSGTTGHEGFAPGDEPADEEPEDDDPGEGGARTPVLRGEDAALRLVQQELGGKVVGTIGD